MLIAIAQGGGYYGCAIMTVEGMTLHGALLRLRSVEGSGVISNVSEGRGLDGRQICAFVELSSGADERVRSDGPTMVVLREWAGAPQPTPIVLFDTGHAQEDMHALQEVRKVLAD